MLKIRNLATLAATALILGSATTHATAQTSLEEFAASLPDEVKRQIARRGKAEFLRVSAQSLWQLSTDGIASNEAIEISRQFQAANQRASFISRFLRYDLNGDLEISRAEIDQQTTFIQQRDRATIELAFLEHDTNKDDALTMAELAAAAAVPPNMGTRDAFSQLMAFDFNGDGKVNLDEIAEVVSVLSEEDTALRRPTANRVQETPACAAPKVPEGHAVTLLTGYEGGALSTVAVNGQSTETRATTVTIEEGDTPLYLFLASFSPIVWDFDGAVDRIKTVVVQRPQGELFGPGVAVAGLAAEIVHFVDAISCIAKVPTQDGRDVQRATVELTRSLKTAVVHAKAKYVLRDVQMPSGTINEARREAASNWYSGPQTLTIGDMRFKMEAGVMSVLNEDGTVAEGAPKDLNAMRDMIRYYPGGVVNHDPEDMVASGPVEAYAVLPSSVGILQLLAEGKIEPINRGKYRIIAEMDRFPGGLFGAHRVTFYVKDGVPVPDGDLGHSTLYSEANNTCLRGSICK